MRRTPPGPQRTPPGPPATPSSRPQVEATRGEVAEVPSTERVPNRWTVEGQIAHHGVGFPAAVLLLVLLSGLAAWLG